MSMSLEERRAERRRKRQMEEESLISSTKSADELHADVQERIARRRKEREERMANITSSVVTVNGEDDFERKRRERREARLRASGDTDYSSTNDYSSRRNRRRGTEDDTSEDISTTSSSFSSYRSRRRRNWDEDEETPVVNEEPPASSVPDTSEEDAAEERRRRQREEDEEEARRQEERDAEEERERQAALEEDRQRQREEERRQEEERLRQEEEERQREGNEAEDESVSVGSSDDDSFKQQRSENKLFIDEDDVNAEKVTEDGKQGVLNSKLDINVVQNVPRVSEGKNRIEFSVVHEKSVSLERGTRLEVNNNKIKDKLNKFEHLKDESDDKKAKDKALIIPIVEKDGFKGKLKKFEMEIKEQDSMSDKFQTSGHNAKTVILTPQTQKLSEKLQQFELAAKSQSATRSSSRNVQFELEKIGSTQNQRKAMLGRWSASETHINKPEVRDMPKRNVLDRWKSVDKQPQEQQTVTSPTERKEVLTKRLSGNTEFIASKYLEKASKSIDENSSPKTPTSASQKLSFSQSFDHRLSSPPPEAQSYHSYENSNQSRSKVTSRWQREESNANTPDSGTPRSRFSASSVERNGRDSSYDSGTPHSRGSSIDESTAHARKSSCQQQEEEEAERERLRQEEEEAAERAARMAAEEGQKKRGKRKGLGGLTPEKKKKLKDFIADVVYDDEELEEKQRELAERLEPLPDDIDYLSSAELRKLIKSLHAKLAQIHSESYDIEFKVNKQEKEIVDLNMKISDSRGKFAKPVLRKVNKTEQKFAALAKKQEVKDDFRETLKSAHDDDEPTE